MGKVKLGDVGIIITGNTPKTSEELNYSSNDICFVKPSDISNDGISYIRNSEFYISEFAREKARILPANSVLVSCIGIIGKVGINQKECAFNQQINAIIPNEEKCVTEYLAYAIYAKKMMLQAIANAPVVPILNKTQFSDIEIFLPSLSEQREVVKKLNNIDSVIYKRKRQLEKLDELIKARFVELFGDPKENPKGYCKKQLKETCNVITGNTPSRAVSEYYGEHIEWIKTDNIVSGLINLTTATEYLSEKGLAVGRTVEKDSILMACIAGSISSIGRVCITDRKVAFNQQINAIVPNDYNTLFLYVMLQISKEYLVEGINMALKGILSKSKLEEKEFILPPMELQKQFAVFVEQTDKTKLLVQKSLDKLELLKKALMQKYFE